MNGTTHLTTHNRYLISQEIEAAQERIAMLQIEIATLHSFVQLKQMVLDVDLSLVNSAEALLMMHGEPAPRDMTKKRRRAA